MLAFPATAFLAALAAVSRVAAAPEPTSPDSSTVVNVGSDITALWNTDSTGNWTDMTIQATGANLAMVPLVTVGRDIDATTLESYTFAAPDVSPNAAIYFLQFTSSNDPSETLWTTRFTIAAADGTTTEPTNSTQADGSAIPWGTGQLNSAYDISNTTSSSAADSSSTVAAASSSTAMVTSTSATSSATIAQTSSAVAGTSAASAAASSSGSGTSAGNKVMAISAGAVVGLAGVVVALL